MDKLKDLIKKYKKSKVNYSSDNNELLEYDHQIFDEYEIDISYNILNNEYYIFIMIEKRSKLIFKGLYKKAKEELTTIYNELKDDLNTFNFENFIEKYYFELKNNLI